MRVGIGARPSVSCSASLRAADSAPSVPIGVAPPGGITIIYALHLEPRFGKMRLDEISTPVVARFRADLVAKKLGDKRINNILAVLSKPLRYAVDCEVMVKAPRIGMFKVERPEIVAWDFEQYARLLAAAKVEGDEWRLRFGSAWSGVLDNGPCHSSSSQSTRRRSATGVDRARDGHRRSRSLDSTEVK